MSTGPSYPPEGRFLYYSGNEKVPKYAIHARPVPRGHRTVGKGWTGYALFASLRQAVERSGIRILRHAPARRLVVDATGTVIGLEVSLVPDVQKAAHQNLYQKVSPLRPFNNGRAERAIAACQILENKVRQRRMIRARDGIVLATGGFVYNVPMLKQFTPATFADNYEAPFRVGLSVGAAAAKMDNLIIGRSISPPSGLLGGIVVNQAGQRLINEDTYSGFLGNAICQQPEGKAWLILDKVLLWKTLREILPSGNGDFLMFGLPALANILFGGTRKGRTLEKLAEKCGINPAGLACQVAEYNAAISGSSQDPLGKSAEYVRQIDRPPFYAINMSMSNPFATTLAFTLGGLKVNEQTGHVLRSDGSDIKGLHAAGRAAVGVCSNGYFSGMSLADCVFSGRRAGQYLAASHRGQTRG